MKIAITGSNGLVGSQLCDYLQKKFDADLVRIPRELLYGNAHQLAQCINNCQIIIHLSGAPILSIWTKKRKKILRDSRVETTHRLCQAVALLENKPQHFICTSAVGIYDSVHLHSEESEFFAHDFLGNLCQDWEEAANQMKKHGVITSIFRLGVVLSRDGGILKKLKPIFHFGLGGRLGSGKQAFPYIHIHDLLHAYYHVITHSTGGIYNLVAPEQTNNREFTSVLGKALNRPAFCHIPAFILRIVLGKASNVLLNGQRVIPNRLMNEGFVFKYLTLDSAILNLL